MKNILVILLIACIISNSDSSRQFMKKNWRCINAEGDLRVRCNNLRNFLTKLHTQPIPANTSKLEILTKYVEARKKAMKARIQQIDRQIPNYYQTLRFKRSY